MNKRRLTCRRGFDRYKSDGLVCAIQLDHVEADEVEHAVITESDERWIDDVGRTIIRQRRDSHYLVGEIANRLYEYEQLGYSPEELKEIVELYKGRKERLNALYGAAAIDTDQLSMHHPYIYVERCNGKSLMQAKAIFEYLKNDVEFTKAMVNGRLGVPKTNFDIKDVIFNDPATIVLWSDGTKTVVKADKEDFDPEKGLAMAISKKALGNKGNYFDIFKKWTSKYEPSPSKAALATLGDAAKGFVDGLKRASEAARNLSVTLRENAERMAVQALKKALNHKKATKADLRAAMEEAITYLEKEN